MMNDFIIKINRVVACIISSNCRIRNRVKIGLYLVMLSSSSALTFHRVISYAS